MKLGMKIKKILAALLGNCILGFGVGMASQALLGADPCISFSQAASSHLGITIGQMITITNVVLLIIVFFIKKENIGMATLFVVLLNQYPVDFITSIIPHSESLIINILWILAGIVLVAIGCDLMIATKLGMGIYDATIFAVASKVNKDFVIVRYFIDGFFLILTIILKGYIGIGTILPYLLTGNLMKLFMSHIERICHFE